MSAESLLKATQFTGSECAGISFSCAPVLTSHRMTVSSNEPLTTMVPLWLNMHVMT